MTAPIEETEPTESKTGRTQPYEPEPILVLWGVPRSTSTAFEWMMRMRGDLVCYHEPFGKAWYQGDDARWPRLAADSPRIAGLTTTGVYQDLLRARRQGRVFIKDFPQYVTHLWTDRFLADFQHTFLIRDPAKVLPSVHRNWPNFVWEEVGFDVQRELFDRIGQRDGSPPPVIDSDDLLEDPYGIVEAYCRASGIPFLPEALSWEPGERNEVLWYDTGGVWHANLKNSDGLKPQPRESGDISGEPDWVKDMYERAMPHYLHLHEHRLQAIRN